LGDEARDVHAPDDLAEHDVITVQPGRGLHGDEELAAVGVGAWEKKKKETKLWDQEEAINLLEMN
jgi:hypothetical protein